MFERKQMVFSAITGILCSFLLLNCGKSKFAGQDKSRSEDAAQAAADGSTAPQAASAEEPILKEGVSSQPGGVQGGHFDLDTATATYAFDSGTTNHHVHQYDDRFNVTGVDYFKLLDSGFDDPAKTLKPEQAFKIIVANAAYSPGAMITINGKSYTAAAWESKAAQPDAPIFSFGGVSGTSKLESLTVSFSPIKPISEQLIPTETKLVRANVEGPDKSYRNGALTIQMIDAKTGQIDPALHVATIGSAGMYWESTIFWHADTKASAK